MQSKMRGFSVFRLSILFISIAWISMACSSKHAPVAIPEGYATTDNSSLPINLSDPNSSVSVKITITDSYDKAITGAEVVVDGGTAVSLTGTEYTLSNITTAKAPLVLIRAPGFMTHQINVSALQANTGVKIILKEVEAVKTVTAASGGGLEMKGGKVTIPANGVKNADGTAYTGTNVTVSAKSVDVDNELLDTSGNPKGNVSQSDLTLTTSDGKMGVQLASMHVEMKGDSGQKLQMADGKKADVTFKLSEKLAENLPDAVANGTTLPVASRNETTGAWTKDSTCSVQKDSNGKWICSGQVSHFSTAAVVYETTYGCIKGELTLAVPSDKKIVNRNHKISQGYTLHVFDSNGKLGLCAVVPTKNSGTVMDSYSIDTRYGLVDQTATGWVPPVFYSQSDKFKPLATSKTLTGSEGSSLQSCLTACDMNPTPVAVITPQIDSSNIIPVAGTSNDPCAKDADNDGLNDCIDPNPSIACPCFNLTQLQAHIALSDTVCEKNLDINSDGSFIYSGSHTPFTGSPTFTDIAGVGTDSTGNYCGIGCQDTVDGSGACTSAGRTTFSDQFLDANRKSACMDLINHACP